MMLFLKRNYFIKQKLFLLIILVNSYFLGSGVYPLVEKNLIWEGNNSSFNSKLPERSAYIDLSIHQIHLAKTLKEKLDIWTNNSKTYKQVGYLSPPGNSFSSILSHWSRESSNFLKENLKNNGFENLREISNGKSSILDNQKLINFLNIKYIYFKNRPNKSLLNNRYKLLNENNGIYLYENLDHFPYFYFGDRVVKNKSFNINDLIKGDIIVNNEIIFENLKKINFKSNEKKIDLIEWKNGSFTFDYVSKINNVFIVHDLWHPNWKVKIQDLKFGNTKVKDEIFIFQANHIFKGLFLPKGNYRFELYYDTKNYNLGLYISGILIIMFVVVFLRIKKNEQY